MIQRWTGVLNTANILNEKGKGCSCHLISHVISDSSQNIYRYPHHNSPSLHLFQALPCLLCAQCDPINRIENRHEGHTSCLHYYGCKGQHIFLKKKAVKELCRNLYLPWILASQEPQRDQAGRLQDTAERKHWGLSTHCLPSLCCSHRCMIESLPEGHRSDREGYREDPDRRRKKQDGTLKGVLEMKMWAHPWVKAFSSSHLNTKCICDATMWDPLAVSGKWRNTAYNEMCSVITALTGGPSGPGGPGSPGRPSAPWETETTSSASVWSPWLH